jgi:hypothetical protein
VSGPRAGDPGGPRAAGGDGGAAAGPFSRRALLVLLVGGIGTFVLGLLLAAFAGDLFGEASAGHDSYSRSLVGWRGLIETLEEAAVPAVVARSAAARRSGPGFPLLLLEPLATDGQRPATLATPSEDRPGYTARENLSAVLDRARGADSDVLFVLSKWRAAAAVERPAWIEAQHLRAPAELTALLARAVDAAEDEVPPDVLLRPDALGVCRCELPGLSEAALVVAEAPQLLAPRALADLGLVPLVTCGDGVLVASQDPFGFNRGELLLVSDPDLWNNRGLAAGDNARLLAALLFGRLRAEGVVVDEVLHGYASADSVLGRALSFPLVLVVIHGALALALLAWATATRFGRPLPPPPALAAGKGLLIDNTAALLRSGGHHGDALGRYLAIARARVARRFSLPEGTSEDDLRDRLARLEAARRHGGGPAPRVDLDEVERAAANRRLSAPEARRLARRVHAWQRALLGEGGAPGGGARRPGRRTAGARPPGSAPGNTLEGTSDR